MLANVNGVTRASLALRATRAAAHPGGVSTVAIALSSDPIGPLDVARALADLHHYAQMTGLDWTTVFGGADVLWADEAPPTPPKHSHHRRRR